MTTSSGVISSSLDVARRTFAEPLALQNWLNVGSSAAALERIHLFALPQPGTDEEHTREEMFVLRPFVLLWLPEGQGYGMRGYAGSASGTDFADSGRIAVALEQNTPSDTQDVRDLELRWMNTLGAILEGLASYAGRSGYLDLTSIRLDEHWRTHPDQISSYGDAQVAGLILEWGSE